MAKYEWIPACRFERRTEAWVEDPKNSEALSDRIFDESHGDRDFAKNLVPPSGHSDRTGLSGRLSGSLKLPGLPDWNNQRNGTF